jgi:hypothetical protein
MPKLPRFTNTRQRSYHERSHCENFRQAGRVVNPVNSYWRPLHRRDVLDSWNGNSLEEIDGYQPAFDRCDREKDYVIAWAESEKRFGRRKAGTS